MANIRAVLGRHKLVEGYRETQGAKRPVLKCGNCARTWDVLRGEDSSIKHDCISDIDLTRMGPAMQSDQLERDMRGHLYGGAR